MSFVNWYHHYYYCYQIEITISCLGLNVTFLIHPVFKYTGCAIIGVQTTYYLIEDV
jgi:hypothetical protein